MSFTLIELGRETLIRLIASSYEPTDQEILNIMERQKLANPHGVEYKPKRQSREEIRFELKFEYATKIANYKPVA